MKKIIYLDRLALVWFIRRWGKIGREQPLLLLDVLAGITAEATDRVLQEAVRNIRERRALH